MPKLAPAYNNRGLAKASAGRARGAVGADFNKALELQPNSPAILLNRAGVKELTGDFAGALADYNRAVEIEPNSAIALNNRGMAKQKSGDVNGALADFNKALSSNPTRRRFTAIAKCCARKETWMRRWLTMTRRSRSEPDWADAYNNRKGETKRLKRDFDGAIADYSKAIELIPTLAIAYNNRGFAKRKRRTKLQVRWRITINHWSSNRTRSTALLNLCEQLNSISWMI